MYKYKIESNNLITKNILSIKARAQTEKDIFKYKPGQYATLAFRRDGEKSAMRSFSLASSPTILNTDGQIEFGIRIGGSYTQILTKLRKGDELFVMGPFGEFTVDPNYNKEVVFIAGGIGITPFMSILRTAFAQKWPIKITLLYSCQKISDIAYREELLNMAGNSNFNLHFFITDEAVVAKNEMYLEGRVSAQYLDLILKNNYSSQDFYLCGPGGFMKAIGNILASKSVNQGLIITEDFSSTSLSGASVQKAISSYALVALATAFLIILMSDTVKYAVKVDALNQKTNSIALPSGAISATATPLIPNGTSATATSTPTTAPTVAPYTPPRTAVS